MGSKDRRGARIDRNKNFGTRTPELGYYLIITDTKKTEKNYFEGLRFSIPADLKDRLVIKVEKTNTINLVNRAIELVSKDPQYRIPWIVFDRDKVKDFDLIIEEAEKNNICVGWSNPCIEIWFFAYFGEMPYITESSDCCSKFAIKFSSIVKQEYDKSDEHIYNKLINYGDQDKALEISLRNNKRFDCHQKPSEMCPATTLNLLVNEILKKINPT